MKTLAYFLLFALVAGSALADGPAPAPAVTGDYLEVRSCDVYTGYCFANSEMNLAGKEAMLFWSVRQGTWNGVKLDGLSVMAVVRTDATMGDLQYEPRAGKAVLIVDAKADAAQRGALADFARSRTGKLIAQVVEVRSEKIEARLDGCTGGGCASVKAGDIAEITTSCLGAKHEICGNEDTFYPPLSKVEGAHPAFTEVGAFNGKALDCTWQIAGKRSAFLASFKADAPAKQLPAEFVQNAGR
jgi:hypothetical protein